MTNVNPTTLRFSRRAGEALRGADYAVPTGPQSRCTYNMKIRDKAKILLQ
jgi:hypothetical protein